MLIGTRYRSISRSFRASVSGSVTSLWRPFSSRSEGMIPIFSVVYHANSCQIYGCASPQEAATATRGYQLLMIHPLSVRYVYLYGALAQVASLHFRYRSYGLTITFPVTCIARRSPSFIPTILQICGRCLEAAVFYKRRLLDTRQGSNWHLYGRCFGAFPVSIQSYPKIDHYIPLCSNSRPSIVYQVPVYPHLRSSRMLTKPC